MERKGLYIFQEPNALNNVGRNIFLWYDLHELQIP